MSTRAALRAQSPDAFARKMYRWANTVQGVDRRTVGQVALKAKTMYLAALTAAVPSRRLRNVGRGARLGVSYDIIGSGNPTALIRATGPWQIGVEGPTAAHTILPRGVGRAKGRSRGARREAKQELYEALFGGTPYGSPAMLFSDGNFRHKVQHPGTGSPPRPWAKTTPLVKDRTVQWYAQAHRAQMAQIFTG